MTMQQCTDATTDKDMSTAFSPMGKEMCSKQDIQKTATGYVSDSICGIAGVTIASHAEITGDFNSAYTVKSTVEYHAPARYDEEIDLCARVARFGRSSMTFALKPDE